MKRQVIISLAVLTSLSFADHLTLNNDYINEEVWQPQIVDDQGNIYQSPSVGYKNTSLTLLDINVLAFKQGNSPDTYVKHVYLLKADGTKWLDMGTSRLTNSYNCDYSVERENKTQLNVRANPGCKYVVYK